MSQARILTDREFRKVLLHISKKSHSARNKCMLYMSHLAGLRVGEISNLTLKHILNDDGTIKDEMYLTADETKGNRGRAVLLPEKLRDELTEYLTARFKLKTNELHVLHSTDMTRALFYSQKSMKDGFDANTLAQWFARIYRETGNYNGFEGSFIYAVKQDNGTQVVKAADVAGTTTSLGVGLNNQVGAKELGLKYAQGPLTVAGVWSKTSLSNFCAAPTQTAAQNTTNATGNTAQFNNNPCFMPTLPVGTTTAPVASPDASQDNKQASYAAKYDFGNGWLVSGALQKTTLGAIGATSTSNYSERSAQFLNAQYVTGPHTVFVSTGSVKENAASSSKNGQTSKFTGLGYNYALSKMTSLVARYEQFDDQANVLGVVLGSPNAYSQMVAASTTDLKRVRSMFGINVNY